jgi:hypothetical protein
MADAPLLRSVHDDVCGIYMPGYPVVQSERDSVARSWVIATGGFSVDRVDYGEVSLKWEEN